MHEYRATIKEYDLFDREIEERLEDSSGNVIHYSRYEYDLNNNRIVEQHGDQITRTEFNLHNNPTKIINGLGHETHTSYNTRFLNGLGQYVLQTITTDPLGYQVVDTYDSAKRLVETLQYNPFGILISKETIHYDLNGNTCKVSDSIIDNQEIKGSYPPLEHMNSIR